MAHPTGGVGNKFRTKHSFQRAYAFVGAKGCDFQSTTNENVSAKQSQHGGIKRIVFYGQTDRREGDVCAECWGFRQACTKTRIGQYAEALDNFIG